MDLKALLAKLNALGLSDDLAQLVASLLAKIEEGGSVSDDELLDLANGLREDIKALAEAGDDDSLALAQELKGARDEVKAEQTARAEAEADRKRRADELLADLDDDADGDADEDDAKAEAEGDEDDAKAEAEAAEKEPVAAAGKPAPAPRITSVRARRPAPLVAEPKIEAPSIDAVEFTASANLPDRKPGEVIRGAEAIAAAFQEVFDNHVMTASRGAAAAKLKVGSIRYAFPEDRTLDRDDLYGNARKIAGVRNEVRRLEREGGAEALAASGGNCFPLNTDAAIRRYGVTERPVRDNAHVRMGAPRGGVKTIPPLSISNSQFDTGVGQWTEANDESPADPTTKPKATLACQDSPRETQVYAVTKRLRLGEFNRRFYPELVEGWWDQLTVMHARKAERYLLSGGMGKTVANSGYAKAITTGENMSATRDVLAALDKASAILRQSRRLGRSVTLNFAFPFWLYELLRVDLSREVPGAADERLAVAEAKIDSFFRLRNINPVPLLEGESASYEFGIVPNASGLPPWPSTVPTYLYLPGEWLVLDGGVLDLGLYRDPTLVDTNDCEMFMESFEAPHFVGLESWRLLLDIVPSGVTQAATTVSFADGS